MQLSSILSSNPFINPLFSMLYDESLGLLFGLKSMGRLYYHGMDGKCLSKLYVGTCGPITNGIISISARDNKMTAVV